MDELEMRRHCIAAPRDGDPEYRAWLSSHAGASEAARNAEHFDQQLRFALQHVQVPDGLDERILLNTDFKARRKARKAAWFGLALAASMVLAASLSWRQAPIAASEDGLAQLALNHVQNEIHHLEHASGTVNTSLVQSLFQQAGAELTGTLGEVQFAFMCPTPKGDALHLVVNTPEGQVTVLYLPTQSAPRAPSETQDDRFIAQIWPIDGHGTLALVAESASAAQSLRDRMQHAVRWQGSRHAKNLSPLAV